ncbi:MAG: aromatic amino acid ammonia-lyase [Bacteroidota bacterium]
MTSILLHLGPDHQLTPDKLEAAALAGQLSVRLSDAARMAMESSRDALEAARAAGQPIYGLTTGFGPHVCYPAASDALQGAGLIAHLAAGAGAFAPAPVVRATVIARTQALAQGYSGVDASLAESLLGLVKHGIAPAVPEIGSVGASGDLTPLAHIVRVLTGEGTTIHRGRREPAIRALLRAGLRPLSLSSREALGLVNGTAFMTAYLSLAVARAERLVETAERLTGWLYRSLGARRAALDARLHHARGHAGQRRSAEVIRTEIAWGDPAESEDDTRTLQEVYALRCAPQILGACRDNIAHARRLTEAELNGVSDNPLVFSDGPAVLHGGNFQGQQIAFAADALNAAITQVGVLAERQLDLLLDPKRGVVGEAPLLLAWEPGETSGLAGAQLTATALVAELRHHAQMSAVASIPTNGGNQDVVSMGTMAARTAYGQTERLAPILAAVGMALAQLGHLRRHERAGGTPVTAPPWMPRFAPLKQDRALHEDLHRIAARWLQPTDALAMMPVLVDSDSHEVAMAEEGALDVDAPDMGASDIDVSDMGAPDMNAPGMDVPESHGPDLPHQGDGAPSPDSELPSWE